MVAAPFSYAPMGTNRRRLMGEERAPYTTPPQGVSDTQAQDGAVKPPTPIFGAITGYAQDVDENINAAAISEKMGKFLNEARRRSFSTAGYQQRAGSPEPGIWCDFDLAAWAAKLGITRSYLWRLREQAVDLHFLTYHPAADGAPIGRLRWNLTFSEWTALQPDYRQQRYARHGAGRKPADVPQASERITFDSCADEDKSKVIRLPATNKSKVIREQIKSDTTACLESASVQARGAALRKKKEDTERIQTDAIASGVASPQRSGEVSLNGFKAPPTHAQPDVALADMPPADTTHQQTAEQTPPLAARPPRVKPAVKPTAAKRERKLTDEQLVAHQEEQAWCAALLAAFRAELGVKSLPNEGAEKTAAKWFYRELMGVADGIEKVIGCYRATQLNPFYARSEMPLVKLRGLFAKYRQDPAGFRKAQEAAAGPSRATPGAHSGRPSAASRFYREQRDPAEFTMTEEQRSAAAVAALRAHQAQVAATMNGSANGRRETTYGND